jgi:CRP/FNR family cyclic AMP-dependent transcriptional regulator
MPCSNDVLRQVPLFSLLDDEEISVLAAHVELRTFAARQRIYKIDDPGERAYVLVSGAVRVTTIDEDHQEVLVDEPTRGEFFGFASMLDRTPHQTNALAAEETVCVEVDRSDIEALLQRKPLAGMDMLVVLGRQYHNAHHLVRLRAARNPNEVIEEHETTGERIADTVASFGGSWSFITACGVMLTVYTIINVALGSKAWDPYPFILLNLILSMLAALQAPVIMMSQNRQDKKDRVRTEMDFDVNRRSEAEIQRLAEKLHLIGDKVDDVSDLLRQRVQGRQA